MRNLRFFKFIPIVLIGMLWFSCSKDIPVPEEHGIENSSMDNNLKGSLLKGKKLPNPYTIPHMEDAKQHLISEGKVDQKLLNEIEIKPTSLYVRFKIKSADDYDVLSMKEKLELFPYPLDYDYGESEGVIVDPEYGDKPEWLYTVVNQDYPFPEIHYEIIDEVFLPKSYLQQNPNKEHLSDILNLIEQKSYELCGFESEKILKSTPVYPSGRITVWNDTLNQWEPVVGVRVRARKFLTYGYGFTDTNGDYTLDEDFTGTLHYCMIMENEEGFKIWGDLAFLSPAVYEYGTGPADGKDLECWEGLQKWRWATANNAVYDYYQYCDSAGISSPPSDLRVWWFDDNSNMGSAGMFRHLFGSAWSSHQQLVSDYLEEFGVDLTVLTDLMSLITPDITITVNLSNVTSHVIYEILSHECAHASHYTHVGNTFWYDFISTEVSYMILNKGPYGNGTESGNGIVQLSEGWAFYTGQQRTLNKYGVGRHINGFSVFDDFTPISTGSVNDYLNYYYGNQWNGWMPAGIFWDLTDTNVDFLRSSYSDNVAGYTISDIHDAMDADVDDMQEFKVRILSENNWHDYTDLLDLFKGYYYY